MEIVIDNKLKFINPPVPFVSWLIQGLTFENPVYREAEKQGRNTRFIDPHIKAYAMAPNGIYTPRGILQRIEDNLICVRNDIEVKDNRVVNDPISIQSSIVLRPSQEKGVGDLLRHPQGMLVSPAGSGKTMMGLEIISRIKQKALWITHTNRLLNQARERIVSVLNIPKEDVGMIGGGKWKVGNEITIGMVQTLARNRDRLPELGREFGIVIVDEAHHTPATTFLIVITHFSSYYLYGLTATPYRRDKLENLMFAAIGSANAVVKRSEVRREKSIVTPRAIMRRIQHKSGVFEERTNDYNEILNKKLMVDANRLQIIISDILAEACANHYCIVLSVRKVYCELIYATIRQMYDKVVIATGDYSKAHVEAQIKEVEAGNANILIATPDLLGEGFDLDKLDRGFVVLPFREQVKAEQVAGRIQRPAKGKEDAVLYDYIDAGIGVMESQADSRISVYRRLGMPITYG